MHDTDSDTFALSGAETAKLVEFIARVQPEKLPVFRALAKGEIALCDVPRGAAAIPSILRGPTGKPVLCIVGDDDHCATGPAAFPIAKRLAYWARRIMVHGTGGQAAHYALAVEATLLVRQVVLIETDAGHLEEWTRFLGDGKLAPILEIRARDGRHPVLPGRPQ
jgi:hypothetical protein